jgi:hypothetical protein
MYPFLWEEFLADIEHHKSLQIEGNFKDPETLYKYLLATRQENDPQELVLARQQVLETTGIYADWTPKMAYNFHFGDRLAFY